MPDASDSEIEGFLRSRGPFEPPPRHPCGERIGDWKILAFLGRGGSSEVYRAENTVTGLVAALKILCRSDASARERFRREVRLVAEMRSAAFPKFYGAGECDGQFYLAEELLEPAPLPMRDAAVARFILGVCAGVDKLHRIGFVHRDIKPGNVMIRPSTGESVLIDMGLAKGIDETRQTRNETLSVVDGHAVGVGTPGFSAPEQFVGGRISAATDIHAIGMLANACFGGKPPRVWTTIIRRSTSSIPEQRYATVEEFAWAVRHRWRGRRIAAICAVFGAAMLGVFVWATSINGGDFWLRQAWLSGRQMRSIQHSLVHRPKTDVGDRPQTDLGISMQVVEEKQTETPPPDAIKESDRVKPQPIEREKPQQSNGDRPRKVDGDRPCKVQEIAQKQNNVDNSRQASEKRPKKVQQKDMIKPQQLNRDGPPKVQPIVRDRPQKVDEHEEYDGDRPQQTQHNTKSLPKIDEPEGDRSRKVDEDKLLGVVWDTINDPLTNRGAEDVKPKPKEVMSEGVASFLELGKVVNENGKVFMRIALDGRDIQIKEDIYLERPRKIVIEGPGRIEASISGIRGVEIELGRHAALINLTDKPYTKSGIQYILCGACYLNFKNLDRPGSDLKNIWVNDLGGKGCPIIRFRGRPDTYDEAVEEQKKIAIELMKKGQLDWF